MTETRSVAKGLAIGIDLGTTFSCAAVVRNGKIEVILSEQGNLATPSFVGFNENKRLIGNPAKQQMTSNSSNTIFDAKRLIGRKFTDPIVQEDMEHWPFKVVAVNGMPKIEITYRNEVKQFSPEEINAMILGQMKEAAELYLGVPVNNAVVAVPAHYNYLQRKAVRDAATIAGLNVSGIINESTAAAIAYGLNNDTRIAKNILIYDLGGGTFDASILRIHKKVFQVIATAGDPHLGGEDFDNRMMARFIDELMRVHNIDISGNKRALRRLRTECERVKRILSSALQTSIEIDSLADGIDFSENISRARFEVMCADLFQSTITTIERALIDANLKSENIDTIVLVGGSTRIPKIQQLLQEKFPGKEICKSVNADEAVAQGAAVQAAIIHGGATVEMKNIEVMEVTPLTLGVHIWEPDSDTFIMHPIIRRNTPIPVSRSQVYVTAHCNLAVVSVFIAQGECRLAGDNVLIGSLTMRKARKRAAVAKTEKFNLKFSIDKSGTLTVTTNGLSNFAGGKMTMENVPGCLTNTEIERMVRDADTYREEDREARQYNAVRWDLEHYCHELKRRYGPGNSPVVEMCNEILLWMSSRAPPPINRLRRWKDELKALSTQFVNATSELATGWQE